MIEMTKWLIEPNEFISGGQKFYLQSFSTNTGINSDSTATAVYAIDNNYALIPEMQSAVTMYSIGDEIEFFLSVQGYAASEMIKKSIYRGNVDGMSYSLDTLTLTLTTNFNAAVKAGDIFQYTDYMGEQQYPFLFDQEQLKGLTAKEKRAKYFDIACQADGVAYWCTHNNVFELISITKDWPLAGLQVANQLTKNSVLNYSIRLPASVVSETPNVYDVGVTLFFTRHQYFVKTFKYDINDAVFPPDINSTVEVDIGDGNFETVYKAKALPAKKSAIIDAIKAAGYTITYIGNTVFAGDVYDYDGVALLYEADPTDDINKIEITAFKYIPREVSVYYWKRFIDQASIENTGRVVYKKVDKTYKVSSENPRTNPDFYPIESMYIDIFQSFEPTMINSILHAEYEMRKVTNTTTMGSLQIAFDSDVRYLWSVRHFSIGLAIPQAAFPAASAGYSSITGVSYNFNAVSGEATISLNCTNERLKPVPYNGGPPPSTIIPPNPHRPDSVVYNASPYEQIGGGFITNLGSGDINDQDSWGMEETADIESKVSGYLDPAELNETDPEEELTNVYVHELYINNNFVDDVPFSLISEKVKLRNDPVKRVYSEPINLYDREYNGGGGGEA